MLSNFGIDVSALLGCQFLSEGHSCFLLLVYSARSPSTLLCPGNAAGSQVLYDPSIPAGGDITYAIYYNGGGIKQGLGTESTVMGIL